MSSDLYDLIISWLDQRDDFSDNLRKLAKELEDVNKNCNAAQAVGNTTTVVGGLFIIGGGIATFFTAGLAAPLLVVGGTCAATGSTVTLTTKLIEGWIENSKLKEAKKISEENKELGEKIEKHIKREIGSHRAVTDDDIIECILKAMAKRHGLTWEEVVGKVKLVLVPSIIILGEALQELGVLSGSGFNLEDFLIKQVAGFAQQAAKEVLRAVGKGAVRVGAGAFTVALTLPDTIENYKRAIENNNVTGPSKELKRAADRLRKSNDAVRAALRNLDDAMRRVRRAGR